MEPLGVPLVEIAEVTRDHEPTLAIWLSGRPHLTVGATGRNTHSLRWESSCSLATRSYISSTDLMR
jgi:hypothetical protein